MSDLGGWLAILVAGMVVTIKLAAATAVLSIALAGVLALMSISPLRILRIFASLYVDVFRSIPILALAISVYYGLGATLHQLGITAFGTGVVVLTAIEGAYLAELYRGSLQSIRLAQWDAASRRRRGPADGHDPEPRALHPSRGTRHHRDHGRGMAGLGNARARARLAARHATAAADDPRLTLGRGHSRRAATRRALYRLFRAG